MYTFEEPWVEAERYYAGLKPQPEEKEKDNTADIAEDTKAELINLFADIMARLKYSRTEAINQVIWAFDSMTDNVGHYNLSTGYVTRRLEKARNELAEWWKVDIETIEDAMWKELEPLWEETPALTLGKEAV